MNAWTLTEEELDGKFYALARYYAIVRDGIIYLCRDVMELRRRGTALELPEAVVVMMNPGGSHPLEGLSDLSREDAQLVAAKPDKTQYQLMRVMDASNLSFVRVINLLDLRTSDSGELSRLLQVIASANGDCELSIFAASRSLDLEKALQRAPGAPIVLAWGCNSSLERFAQAALEALSRHQPVIGWKRPDSDCAFFHPLPRGDPRRQAEWLQIIYAMIQKLQL